MRAKDLEFVRTLARFISLKNRFPLSEHHLVTRELIETALGEIGEYQRQEFEFSLLKPVEAKVETYEPLEAFPYTNSPPLRRAVGTVVDCGYGTYKEIADKDLKGKIALVREGKRPFREKEKQLKTKGVKAILVFREEVNEIYHGISAGLLPVISIKREDALKLSNTTVEVSSYTKPFSGKGINYWVDFGYKGPILTFVAHYDTKPITTGAIDNGLSVALLIWLASKLAAGEFKKSYRVRILFTDLEEYGLLGAERFVSERSEREIKTTVAVAVDTVGWDTPAVLYRDGEGLNDAYLMEKVARMLEYLKLREEFAFKEGRSGRSDHIPFRKRGARTLFFASNPFPLRHTVLDTYSAINWEVVRKWMQLLLLFANSFTRFAA